MRSPTLAFILGFLLAVVLGAASAPVSAQLASIAFGSHSGTPVPVAVSATGVVSVVIQ